MVQQLEDSSAWYESLGFKPPYVRSRGSGEDKKWLVLLGPGRLGNNQDLGYYEYTKRILAFGLLDYFQIEGEDDSTATPTHELFHAVQGSYRYFRQDQTGAWGWFDEGTAAMAEAFYLGDWNVMGQAFWDYPLNDLKSQEGSGWDDYVSYPFWRAVGTTLSPQDPLSAFPAFMERLNGKQAPIQSIDAVLKQMGTQGLWQIYPEFHADLAHRGFSLREYFQKPGATIEVEGHEDSSNQWVDVSGKVRELAANYHQVLVKSIGDSTGILEIRLEGDDKSSLHLIVDDENLTPRVGDRHTYRKPLSQEATFEVRVANVAIAAHKTRDQNYTLKARVLTEYASMGRGGGGPSAADIDAPLPFELDTVHPLTRVLPGPLHEHVEKGLEDVCMVQFVFNDSRTGDGLGLKMDIEGPLRPGIYSIHDADFTRSADNPGMFGARFGIGHGNALGQGFNIGFRAVGGTVTLDTVSKHFITGRATIIGENGENGKPTHCVAPSGQDAYYNPKGNRIKCPGPQGMVIEAKFGVIPRTTGSAWRLGKSLDQCINSKPIPPQSMTAPGDPPPPGYGAPGFTLPEEEDKPEISGPGLPEDEVPPAPGSAEPGPPDAPTEPGDFASGELVSVPESERWVVITTTGAFDETIVLDDLQFTGGCSGSTPASMGVHRGQPNSEDYVSFAFKTAEVVGTGETGAFAVSEIRWDHGTVSPQNMPPELNIRVPNRFEGTGKLDLTTHSASLKDRSMEGVITATGMSNKQGEAVDIEARFRLDWSCGIEH